MSDELDFPNISSDFISSSVSLLAMVLLVYGHGHSEETFKRSEGAQRDEESSGE